MTTLRMRITSEGGVPDGVPVDEVVEVEYDPVKLDRALRAAERLIITRPVRDDGPQDAS